MQLVQERDGKDQLPASNVFSEPETETLEVLCPTLEGNTRRQQNPHPPESLAWAAWIISRLGGWNCYYKPAGPITMRRRHGAVLLDPPRQATRNDAETRSENPVGRRPGGKTSRRAHAKSKGRQPLHLVSAWASRQRLVLGQEATDIKSNEITAIPLLLERLELQGALVTPGLHRGRLSTP
jgi:hypothetical protein